LGHYERAIQADAADDKAHYQLISARAALLEPEVAVARYEKRLQDTPDSVREHRLLAAAYLAARAYTNALDVVARGLALDGADARLVEFRGDARAGLGDSDGALKDWRRALELDSTTISALYSTAFLHERDGRIDDAIAAWQEIIQWSRARGFERDIQWPHDEIERLGGSAARKGG
jgi:tetratricopeptide (TPR) repeat protein